MNLHTWRVLAGFCFTITILSAIIAGVFPILVQRKLDAGIRDQVTLSSPNSEGFADWVDSTRPDAGHEFIEYYLYNITNPFDVLNGAKPIVQEVGPLVYHYYEYMSNVSWNADQSIMSYYQWIRYVPMPGTDELASQFIYSINMPFQGLVGREPGLLALLLENKTLQITEFDALFINRTINETLWGYLDPALFILSLFDPGLNPRYRGLQVNATSADEAAQQQGTLQEYTGVNHPELLRSMLTFDDMAGMNCCGFGSCGLTDRGGDRQAAWLGAPANVIRGSLGRQFPTGQKKGGTLPLFIPQYYRAIDVENMNGETVESSGITAYRYRIPASVYENMATNPANGAFRAFTSPNGLFNVTTCEYKARIFLSKPHFLDGDPGLSANVTGMRAPDRALDDTNLDVEPITGTTIGVNWRVQINTLITPLPAISNYFSKIRSTYVPLLWANRYGSIQQSNVNRFKNNVLFALHLKTGLLWGFVALAIVSFLFGLFAVHKYRRACANAKAAKEGQALLGNTQMWEYGAESPREDVKTGQEVF